MDNQEYSMQKHIAFIMGPTCSGKTSFLEYAKAAGLGKVGLVEVGKMMRAKYSPEHFAGQAAPKHTAEEAWSLCEDAVNRHLNDNDTELILVDGQPRSYDQVHRCLSNFTQKEITKSYILLDSYNDERTKRAKARFTNDPASTQLALDRIKNDMITYYVVLAELLKYKQHIRVVDTNKAPETYQNALLLELLS